ncbi:unnamed protein product [Heterobilharzia americana]|nr:unnamed protein product [Heterobilharzia americana]
MGLCVQATVFCILLPGIYQVTCQTAKNESNCSELGEFCDKTIFNRCCRDLVCELKGFANGTCVECLGLKYACLRNSDCCSKFCHLFRCRERQVEWRK